MKQERSDIIKTLVKNKFDIETLKEFTARVINTTVRNRSVQDKIKKEYKDYIESYQVIGDYEDKDSKKIYIISVKTKDKFDNGRDLDPTKARTKQRNFIADLLRGNDKIPIHDGALVNFYNDIKNSWRLSFVKLDYSFTFEGIKEKLTPVKRLSYVLGEGEATHTAEKQLTSLIGADNEISLEQLESIFQIKKVTSEFFDKYKEKYLELKEHLEKDNDFINEALKHTEKIKDFSEEFAKKLMGQLAFLYFLQKKGWLGVKATPSKINKAQYNALLNNKSTNEKDVLNKVYKRIDESEYKRQRDIIENLTIEESDILMNCFKNTPFEGKWGEGEKKFVRELFEQHKRLTPEKNFFEDYLGYLFYESLNSQRGENQYYKKFNCKIPFLNGGLFEPYEGYKWQETNFHIPDELFSNDKKEGILDIFDRFNFTISENEPFETEVAVDPEMLGKVFENLLDVKDRKSKGAFYTPREIVHYMCKESLINYLDNEIEEVERIEIEELLQLGEFTKEYDTHIFEMDYMNGNKNNDWGMPINLLKNIEKIDIAIKNVKVADPAIGSGAFPLGMLMEIVKVRNVLTEYFIMHEYFKLEKENKISEFWDIQDKILDKRSLYNLKIETIENCLFGVDIEPSAVEIAKLRLWLSIVVDSENDNINPLPNLDFNFMVGNSLLDEFEGIKLFDEKLLEKLTLTKSQKKYETNSEMLAGVQRKLDGSINISEVINWIQYLRPVYFDEKETKKKKSIKDRIDNYEWILIQETLKNSGNEDKIKELEKLRKEKRKPYFLWKLEFAEVFKEKGGFDIVIGNPPYIPAEKIPNADKKIYERIFSSAFGRLNLYILFYEKGLKLLSNNGNLTYITPYTVLKNQYYIELRRLILKKYSILEIIDFKDNKVFKEAVVDTIIMSIMNSMKKNKIKLISNIRNFTSKEYNIAYIEDKVFVKNSDLAFDINNDTLIDKLYKNSIPLKKIINFKQGIITGNNKKYLKTENENSYVKIIKGKNFNRYTLEFDNIYLNYEDKLHRPRTSAIFEVSEKILIRQTGSYPIATLDTEKFYTLDSVHNGTLIDSRFSLKFIISLLNSKLIRYIYESKINESGKVFAQVKIIYINELPIKDNISELLKFEYYVDKIMKLKKQNMDTTDLENEIDEMVYDLYELTEEEKEIVIKFKN